MYSCGVYFIMRYIHKIIFLSVILAGICFSSCKKDKSTNTPVVFLTPDDLYIKGEVGDVISISVTVRCDDKMNRFYITSHPDNGYQTTVFDTSFASKKFTYLFQYKIPSSVSGKSVVFSFNAIADNGNTGTSAKRLIIESEALYKEYSNNRMYANNPSVITTEDAFDLELRLPKQSAVTDSSLRDIQDKSGNDTTISKMWYSPAGGKFVRYNSFDYANATLSTVISAFKSGIPLDIIDNIKEDDVIITKLGSVNTDIYVVIKVVTVHDDIGKNNDYYNFNIKSAP